MADDFDDGSGSGDDFDENETAQIVKWVKNGLRQAKRLVDYIEDTPNAFPEIGEFLRNPTKEGFDKLHNGAFAKQTTEEFQTLIEQTCCPLHTLIFLINVLINDRANRLAKTAEGHTIQ